ncbi:MAG: hypothetical protein IJ211_01555 [Campylobacter sp.]|nr:hypothetical protein [Campylobacter sp.]
MNLIKFANLQTDYLPSAIALSTSWSDDDRLGKIYFPLSLRENEVFEAIQ